MQKYRPREDWGIRAHRYLQKLKKRRAKHYYRCGKCRKRRVLAKELWEYMVPPRHCGGVFWTLDMDRYSAWKNQKGAYAVCRCGNSSWDAPHKPGSIIWCEHSGASLKEREQAWEDRRR